MRLPVPAPTEAPSPAQLEIRQESNFYVITQTLTRQSTTITTLVTLGSTAPTPPPEASPSPPPIPTSQPHKGLTGEQIGGILGGVVGFVVLLLLVGFCYVGNRRMPIEYDDKVSSRATHSYLEEEETTTHYRSKKRPRPQPTVSIQKPPPVAERIPGGPKFPTYRAIPIPNPRKPQVRRVS